jgi:hypothetical protein
VVDEPRQQLNGVQSDGLLVMVSSGDIGKATRRLALVKLRCVEADRERSQRVGQLASRIGDDRARINTTGQESAERHVGDEMRAHGIFQRGIQRLDPLRLGTVGVWLPVQAPIASGTLDVSVGTDDQMMARLKLAHATIDRERRRNVLQVQVVIECIEIDAAIQPRPRSECLDFGREGDAVAVEGITKWFDADPVARQQQALQAPVPERKCEHAAQMMHDIGTPLLVSVHDCLAIAVAAEPMASRHQFGSQLAIVVDLTVRYQPDGLVFIRQRLSTRSRINDCKTSVRECDRAFQVDVAAIGAAVFEPRIHGVGHVAPRWSAVKVQMTGDAAHQRSESGLRNCMFKCSTPLRRRRGRRRTCYGIPLD